MNFDKVETGLNAFYEAELGTVRKHIKKHTNPKFKSIKKIIDDITDLNGKMLRPLSMIIAAQFGRYESDKVTRLAAAVEMLHMATLVHDDIIDDAAMRRHKPSVHSKYGKDLAVYAGDYLLSKALTAVNPSDYQSDHIKELARGIEKICESELIQYDHRYHLMNVKQYIRVVSGKTAALFAISMYVGASEAKASENEAKILGKIGYEIGMAFQIIDDILDFSTHDHVVGKTIGNDVKKGYYTLPVIYALEANKHLKVEALNEKQLMEWIYESKGIEKSRLLAHKYTERAYKKIASLHEGVAKEALLHLTHTLLDREY